MGLDMYMTGRKYAMYSAPKRQEEGFEIEAIEVKLGYWRKVPTLHGYIVQNFGPTNEAGEREDDCRDIDLPIEAIKQIIEAAQNDQLPATKGFFFGESYMPGDEGYEDEKKDILEQLGYAVQWLALGTEQKDYWYSVTYRASW